MAPGRPRLLYHPVARAVDPILGRRLSFRACWYSGILLSDGEWDAGRGGVVGEVTGRYPSLDEHPRRSEPPAERPRAQQAT
eukprot:scaffold48707_cov65-Phaeocystis_antarctica.AAC.2